MGNLLVICGGKFGGGDPSKERNEGRKQLRAGSPGAPNTGTEQFCRRSLFINFRPLLFIIMNNRKS